MFILNCRIDIKDYLKTNKQNEPYSDDDAVGVADFAQWKLVDVRAY